MPLVLWARIVALGAVLVGFSQTVGRGARAFSGHADADDHELLSFA